MSKAMFEKWFDENYPSVNIAHGNVRDEIWQYFHREFPRDSVSTMITGYVNALDAIAQSGHTVGTKTADGLVNKIYLLDLIERLWNGDQGDGECKSCDGKGCEKCDTRHLCPTCGGYGEVPPHSKPEACHDCKCPSKPCPDCKPICPTCRGSKEVPVFDCKCKDCLKIKNPCPDCTEQFTFLRQNGLKYPNQRKGERRVRNTEAVIIIGKASRDKDNYITRNTDGEIRFVCIGQREEDRRIEKPKELIGNHND